MLWNYLGHPFFASIDSGMFPRRLMWFEVAFLLEVSRSHRLWLCLPRKAVTFLHFANLCCLFARLDPLGRWLSVAKEKDEEIRIPSADTLDTGLRRTNLDPIWKCPAWRQALMVSERVTQAVKRERQRIVLCSCKSLRTTTMTCDKSRHSKRCNSGTYPGGNQRLLMRGNRCLAL